MSLDADTPPAGTPVPMPAGAGPDPHEDPAPALLQLDFDASELPKRSTRLEWSSPPASIKEALTRWLDEQL